MRRTAGRDALWLHGRFDPLLAHQARFIEQQKSPGAAVVIVVDDGQQPLLDLRARRELAASLRAVDYVSLDGVPAGAASIEVDDAEARQAFISRVRARCGVGD